MARIKKSIIASDVKSCRKKKVRIAKNKNKMHKRNSYMQTYQKQKTDKQIKKNRTSKHRASMANINKYLPFFL